MGEPQIGVSLEEKLYCSWDVVFSFGVVVILHRLIVLWLWLSIVLMTTTVVGDAVVDNTVNDVDVSKSCCGCRDCRCCC